MTDGYPETLAEAKEVFPDADTDTLQRALRGLRQAKRDAQCDCEDCRAEEKRLAENHDGDG